MKTRDARRLSSSLFWKGVIRNDFVEAVLRENQLRFNQPKGKYEVYFVTGNRKIARRHRCVFRLARIVYSIKMFSISKDQGTVLQGNERATILQENLKFPLIPIPDVCPPSTRLKKPKAHPLVQKALDHGREFIPQHIVEGMNEYQHSSYLNVESKLASQVKLGSLPARETDLDLEFIQFVRHCIAQPRNNKGPLTKDLDFSVQNQKKVSCGSTNSGYVPVSRDKQRQRDKRTMQDAAIMVNEHDKLQQGPLSCLPHKMFLKSEVLKKGKTCRVIQISSQCNYIIDSLVTTSHTQLMLGDAIGAGVSTHGFKRLVYNWFLVYQKETGKGWDEFCAYLSNVHESDKTGWEATTNEADGRPWVFSELAIFKNMSRSDMKLFTRSLADYVNPLIGLGNIGFFAFWRVASGTERTSRGNTKRHGAMNLAVCDLIEAALYGCKTCWFCSKVTVNCKFSRLIIMLKRLAMKLGDDYAAPSEEPEQDAEFDRLIDLLFGTITKTVIKPAFLKPQGWNDEGGFEFLRKSFYVDEDGDVQVYRQSKRVLAKLYLGQARSDPDIFHQALLSARYEAGNHPSLQRVLEEIGSKINSQGAFPQLKTEVGKLKQKSPQVADIPSNELLTFDDLVNMGKQTAHSVFLARMDQQLWRRYRMSYEQYLDSIRE